MQLRTFYPPKDLLARHRLRSDFIITLLFLLPPNQAQKGPLPRNAPTAPATTAAL